MFFLKQGGQLVDGCGPIPHEKIRVKCVGYKEEGAFQRQPSVIHCVLEVPVVCLVDVL